MENIWLIDYMYNMSKNIVAGWHWEAMPVTIMWDIDYLLNYFPISRGLLFILFLEN